MIGSRTRHLFAQFLALPDPMVSIVLLGKYGVRHYHCRQGNRSITC
ncbi:hypothetical protein ACFOGG_02895 [Brenneria rubrifaciens]